MTDPTRHDVVILGGGLSGLSLALQLRNRLPELDIVVLERRAHPVPEAAHKVGESTVEIGAHYFSDVLGLRDHLETRHIVKFGFRFFFSEGRCDLDQLTELGVSQALPTPTWQIDRGIFENFLGDEARRRGIDFRPETSVRGFELGSGDALHRVQLGADDGGPTLHARWLIDAAGRGGLIKRKLDLAQANAHDVNAAWFRLDARLPIDDWCDNAQWRARCMPQERWRSTNHLCGSGYWVWMIPLASGAHSVGIVCDANQHPLATMNTFERALDWLQRFQPALGRQVAARAATLLDFKFLRDLSYRSRQVFSGDRWALTGDAGVFLDPFYSPGSDFIAMANTYICELIARDRAGESVAPYARIYEQLYLSFYDNTLALYRDQYALFGDAQVMSHKVIWDYTYYWGVLCQLVFQDRLTDLALFGELRPEFDRAAALNLRMQAFFRRWLAAGGGDNPARLLDQSKLDWFHEMNRRLHEPLDDGALRARLREYIELMHALAAAIGQQALATCPELDVSDLPPGRGALPMLFPAARRDGEREIGNREVDLA